MQTDQQKRILGYFIEEAQEHLTTIETSLMNLQGVVDDPEAMSEMFRAAHSVKGGAAMLGLHSIQQISHKLEDYFKILKEHPVRVDETLETLFLQGFDALRELLDELQSPFGLSEEVANQALSQTEPVFDQLEAHLSGLVSGAPTPAVTLTSIPIAPTAIAEPSDGREFVFQTDVPERLRGMLQLFKQADSPEIRQELQAACVSLGQLGEPFDLQAWVNLLEAAERAIANPDNSLLALAPTIIKDIKAARDLVLAQQEGEIRLSPEMLPLLPVEPVLESPLVLEESLPEAVMPMATLDPIGALEASREFFPSEPEVIAAELREEAVAWQTTEADLSELDDIFELSGELPPPWPGLDYGFESTQPVIDADDDLSEFLESTAAAAGASNEMDLSGLFGERTAAVEDLAELGGLDFTSSEPDPLASGGVRDEEVDLATFFAQTTASQPLEPQSLEIPADAAGLGSLIDTLLEGIDQSEANLTADSEFLDTFLAEEITPATLEALTPPGRVETPTSDWRESTEVAAVLDELIVPAPELSSLGDQENLEQLATSADLEAFMAATADEPLPSPGMVSDQDDILNDLSEISEIFAGRVAATPVPTVDFEDLDALLAEAPPQAPETVADPTPAWDDLESLLEEPVAGTESVPAYRLREFDSLLTDLTPNPALSADPISPALNLRPRTTRRSASAGFDQTMRVSVKHLDGLNNLVGELVVNRNALEDNQERLRQFLDNLLYQVQQLGDVSQQMQDLYDRSLLESSLFSSISQPRGFGRESANDPNHATGVQFDSLEMDRFTGFHTLSQEVIERIVRVREAASDIEYVVDEVEQTTRMFRQVTTQVQESLSRSRMVPFREMATRLPGAVRQIASKCGKQANLEIEGEGILVDKGILERLYDPMTHLINNAIYHGIETPEERRAKGKPEKGTVKIRAFYQGSQTIISVSDDGHGIDSERVKAKAIATGIISASEANHLTRQDIYGLLFRSGFSTKDQADDLAGRGVGMDVVRVSLEEIRGSINTDSTLGKGTTFTIRLPLTLSITKALCCIDNHCRIAFPIDGVEDMLDIPEDRLQVSEDGEQKLAWRDRQLTFRRLTDLLPYRRQISRSNVYGGASHEEDVISVVILRSADDLIALQVDQVIGEQEIVIKQLAGPVPKPMGIAGVTVQGDGRAMAIADILELVDLSLNRLEPGDWGTPMPPLPEEPVKTEPLVLIIDDSITVRELLSMTFTRAGYRVEQARDGQDAWEKLRSGLPCDLVFCDIEMPRMDGLELLSRMQKDPTLSQLPIAMLTSRGADRHRQMAAQLGARGYFTKPYLEEQLLDAANRLLQGEVLVSEPVT
ncbi:response regulator [Synechococcus sp. PCC 6312]|uniref:response regulator n=1 Tax=Synechococcus sp. (strain ATCC 27167 / PCC 6312) TaxID=195253 RepID=UPI00029EF0BC|nr:response regulator [Synechococcus sp. PCC 6312]AFY59282.1 chemotaxis protein histidine kinase-like protein [Synechococcus sp. PCC 6312]